MKKTIFIVFSFFIISLFLGCGKRISKTYVDQQKNVLLHYNAHDFRKALELADKFVLDVAKNYPQDTYVALLERGKIALDAREYNVAIKDLSEAEKRFLDIEGTISLSEEASSLFLDDTTKEYEAAPLEKIMISPYLLIAYFGLKDFEGARVERNRVINKINTYIESNKPATDYLENPFARYISAIIYENEGKFQDARIEYTKIKETKKYLETLMENEIKRIKSTPKLSDLVVFVDLGMSPIKIEVSHKTRIDTQSGPKILSIVYPSYRAREYVIKSCKILINGQEVGETQLLYNLGETILAQYEKDKDKQLKALIARAALKLTTQVVGDEMAKQKGTAGTIGAIVSLTSKVSSAIERADLRSWTSLPSQIQFLRSYNLKPGKYTLKLLYLNQDKNVIGESEEREIEIKDGQVTIEYFRTVR
ncbi:MAG TPA: hypothetical protein PKW55_02270 [Spirochaetota bacterium]|nr:hypothetical protein [Spirochaetota bacterium]HOM38326.1 hypothetical protein [Spirochaetota bacterium]HPQ48456.1 hypothetical protein [Spirochaetota bacterium]